VSLQVSFRRGYARDAAFRQISHFRRGSRAIPISSGSHVAHLTTSGVFPQKLKICCSVSLHDYKIFALNSVLAEHNYRIRVDTHYTARHDTTRQSILSWSPHARIHISPSPIANDKDSVAGIERIQYFACLFTDDRCECMLFFVVSCRVVVVFAV
jgi:hypothetical protein